MSKFINGMRAGFIATGILSVLMLAGMAAGIMPVFDTISMLSVIAGKPETPLAGWIVHFAIGTVAWGFSFVLMMPHLPGRTYTQKGTAFGVIAWFLMMLLVMPMANAGLFGLSFGVMTPVMTLVLHLVFGAVLGAAYGMHAKKLMLANMK